MQYNTRNIAIAIEQMQYYNIKQENNLSNMDSEYIVPQNNGYQYCTFQLEQEGSYGMDHKRL